ncbi:MAG: murein L,D-transpeptidase family protein [Negativicutes bacterium]
MLRRFLLLLLIVGFVFCGYPGVSSASPPADQEPLLLVISKSAHTLTLIKEGQPIKKYTCVFGVNPDGDKLQQGDNRTPEGTFFITDKEKLGNHPYLGRTWLGLSYPAPSHAERAAMQNLISPEQYRAIVTANRTGEMPPQNTKLGGWIGIHGGREDLTKQKINWTEGCIAMLDSDLEELYAIIPLGAKVIIRS